MRVRQKPRDFRAIKWTGENKAEIRTFFADMGYRVNDLSCSGRLEGPYFDTDEDPEGEYNTLQFQCCDDHEVDPGNYVVFVWAWDAHGIWGDTEQRWYYYATVNDTRLWDEFELETP